MKSGKQPAPLEDWSRRRVEPERRLDPGQIRQRVRRRARARQARRNGLASAAAVLLLAVALQGPHLFERTAGDGVLADLADGREDTLDLAANLERTLAEDWSEPELDLHRAFQREEFSDPVEDLAAYDDSALDAALERLRKVDPLSPEGWSEESMKQGRTG